MSKDGQKVSVESWVVRLDRGLSDQEKEALERLKESDPKFREELKSYQDSWSFIKEFAPEVSRSLVEEANSEKRKRRIDLSAFRPIGYGGLAAGLAAIVLFVFWFGAGSASSSSIVSLPFDEDPITERFSDGSFARINSGSEIEYLYTDRARLIRLTSGEAHFDVVENEAAPFVVYANKLKVKAVGTAFNVKIDATGVHVIVTEGEVEVIEDFGEERREQPLQKAASEGLVLGETLFHLGIGQKAEIEEDLESPKHLYSVSDDAELDRELNWREPLLTFSGPTLKDLAIEFERKTGLVLLVEDLEIE
ncbi:MAG: FecR domain-containing protein, partial [Verrucomicrobiota bacterium]